MALATLEPRTTEAAIPIRSMVTVTGRPAHGGVTVK
jgi:hypothetical protein